MGGKCTCAAYGFQGQTTTHSRRLLRYACNPQEAARQQWLWPFSSYLLHLKESAGAINIRWRTETSPVGIDAEVLMDGRLATHVREGKTAKKIGPCYEIM